MAEPDALAALANSSAEEGEFERAADLFARAIAQLERRGAPPDSGDRGGGPPPPGATLLSPAGAVSSPAVGSFVPLSDDGRDVVSQQLLAARLDEPCRRPTSSHDALSPPVLARLHESRAQCLMMTDVARADAAAADAAEAAVRLAPAWPDGPLSARRRRRRQCRRRRARAAGHGGYSSLVSDGLPPRVRMRRRRGARCWRALAWLPGWLTVT